MTTYNGNKMCTLYRALLTTKYHHTCVGVPVQSIGPCLFYINKTKMTKKKLLLWRGTVN